MNNAQQNTVTAISPLLAGLMLILLSCALYLPGLSMPFSSTGEPREALVAQSMVLHSDLFYSVRIENDLATKPPLLHWAMVAARSPDAPLTERSSRLPSVIAAMLASLVWMLFLLPRVGLCTTLLSTLILITSPEWFRHAALARVDMLLAANITLSLVALYCWIEQDRSRFLYLAILPLALGALTKGPVAVALPALVGVLALLWWKKLSLKKLLSLSVISALALVPLVAWYTAEYWHLGEKFFNVVVTENLGRLMGTMVETGENPHQHGPFYLFGAFLLGLAPWSLFYLISLAYIKRKQIPRYSEEETEEGLSMLLEWCTLATLVFFAVFLIPSSKRGVYLLPIYPAASLVIATGLRSVWRAAPEFCARQLRYAAVVFFFLGIALFIFRTGVFNPGAFISSEHTKLELNFFSSLFKFDWKTASVAGLILLFFPLILTGLFIWSTLRQKQHQIVLFALLMSLWIFVAKSEFVPRYAYALSSKNFIAHEIIDHAPRQIALSSDRMYAEAFYARQTNPNILVKRWDGSDPVVLTWLGEDEEIPNIVYRHVSEYDVKKPGKHLEFLIRESSDSSTPSAER